MLRFSFFEAPLTTVRQALIAGTTVWWLRLPPCQRIDSCERVGVYHGTAHWVPVGHMYNDTFVVLQQPVGVGAGY
jgi:hypothetical protein